MSASSSPALREVVEEIMKLVNDSPGEFDQRGVTRLQQEIGAIVLSNLPALDAALSRSREAGDGAAGKFVDIKGLADLLKSSPEPTTFEEAMDRLTQSRKLVEIRTIALEWETEARRAADSALAAALAEVARLKAERDECFKLAAEATPQNEDRDSAVRRVACLATRFEHEREANAILRAKLAASERERDALTDQVNDISTERDQARAELADLSKHANENVAEIHRLERKLADLAACARMVLGYPKTREKQLAKMADYMTRAGLNGSILRDDAALSPPPTRKEETGNAYYFAQHGTPCPNDIEKTLPSRQEELTRRTAYAEGVADAAIVCDRAATIEFAKTMSANDGSLTAQRIAVEVRKLAHRGQP